MADRAPDAAAADGTQAPGEAMAARGAGRSGEAAGDSTTRHVFRLSRLAYLAVLFLLFCTIPLAFTADGSESSNAVVGPRLAFLLIPVLAATFIARTATIIGPDGITVRAVFGTRHLAWTQIRGLSLSRRSIYAVTAGGAVRLPCVRIANLWQLAQASGGHLPPITRPTLKYAPAGRGRR